jgi:hypothetical protein
LTGVWLLLVDLRIGVRWGRIVSLIHVGYHFRHEGDKRTVSSQMTITAAVSAYDM